MRGMDRASLPIQGEDMIALEKAKTVRQPRGMSRADRVERELPNSIARSGVMAAAMNGLRARSLDGR
jgi:hypothetical protein